jgi:site-specific recombinase XerD
MRRRNAHNQRRRRGPIAIRSRNSGVCYAAKGGLDLDSEPTIVATLAQGYAGQSTTGEEVSPATINQRLAILSSFYTYAQKRDVLERNPITLVDRRPVQHKDAALPLEQADVQTLLQAIDRADVHGARDYALLSVLLVTGRRSNELANLRYGDIRFKGKNATAITWLRCKGAKVMYDELPTSTTQALLAYLHKAYGAQLAGLDKDAPVWVSVSRHNAGKAISAQAIADICEQRLGTSKVHATRHTFAAAMEAAGAKLSDIGARLGHHDLKTTSEYMKRMHSAEHAYADKIEVLFGIDEEKEVSHPSGNDTRAGCTLCLRSASSQ